jgi:signal peptidase II
MSMNRSGPLPASARGPLPASARSARAGFPAHLTRRTAALTAGIGLLGLAADAATKAWALSALHGGHRITLAGGLVRLQLVANHGAAFGIGAGYEPLIVAVSVVGFVLIALWALVAATGTERFGAALAAAGAAGNLVDRLTRPLGSLHGAVIDWIHVSFYAPTFNLADVWLRGGILIAVLAWLWNRRSQGAS